MRKIRLDDSCLNHLTNIPVGFTRKSSYIHTFWEITYQKYVFSWQGAYAPDATCIATPLIIVRSTLCLKNDTDVAHYNFNAHHQIECAIKWWFVIPSVLTSVENMNMNPRNFAFFSDMLYTSLENDTALTCYIFDMRHPTLIIFVDNKVVLLSTVRK